VTDHPDITVDLTIETMVNGGDGLARHQGKVVFIGGVLPGERVKARIIQRKKDFDRAELIQIVEASPDRIEPPCPAADRCGGCNWLHIHPEAQARIKVDLARALYERIGGFDPGKLAIETGPPLGYRHRLQVHADAQGRLGFMGRGSAQVTAVDHCPVAHATLQPLFTSVGAALSSTPSASRQRLKPLARLHAFGHDTMGRAELHREDRPNPGMPGSGTVRVQVLGKTFAFPLNGFFQSNLTMLERLIPFALNGLKGSLALDLYSGVGLFAAFLQDHFTRVVALEEASHSVAFIAENAGRAVQVYQGRLEDLASSGLLAAGIAQIGGEGMGQNGSGVGRKPDAIVVDPPREGLHADARQFLVQMAAPELVYVSCDVATQARDLKALLAHGYALSDLRLFDFYPQTHHLEAVARLQLK
jgi:23S rRNA (uracil1939-C5)-methyltransferase